MKHILFILSLILLISCQHHKSKLLEVDVRAAIRNEKSAPLLSDITKQVKYIALETNKECLLRYIRDVFFYKEYLYVADNSSLIQFDKEGNYVRKIGRKGKGPGELGREITFDINTSLNEIYIYTHNSKIQVYDLLSGSFKRSFTVAGEISKIVVLENDKILAFGPEGQINGDLIDINKYDYQIDAFVYDIYGNKIDSIVSQKNDDNLFLLANRVEVLNADGNICFKNICKDTLWSITTDYAKKPYMTL